MSKPPLWEVMYRADAYRTPASDYREDIAPVIRAVRDWIKKARPNYDEVLHGVIRADELDSILALLTAEADRAEWGDDPWSIAAATLRAAVDQVVPEAENAVGDQHDEARLEQWPRIRRKLLAIADKLEGRAGSSSTH